MPTKPTSPAWQPGAVGTPGCRLYLPLCHYGGSPRDYSGYGNHSTVAGTPAWGYGRFGPHLSGWSSSNYLNLDAAAPVANTYPFYLWALFSTTTTGWTRFFCFSDSLASGTRSLELNRSAAGDAVFQLAGISVRLASAGVNDGNPHVLAAVSYATNDHRLYIDGAQAAAGTTTIAAPSCAYGALGCFRYSGGQSTPFSGSVVAAGAGNGPVPDMRALAADLLSGTFAAVRDRRPSPGYLAALFAARLDVTFGVQAQAASTSFGARTRAAGTLAAQAQAATAAFAAAQQYAATLGAAAGPASLAFAATTTPLRSLRADVRAALLADAAVSAVAGARVYPLRVPELSAAALPAVTYQVVDNPRAHHLAGPGGVASARVRVTAVSRNYADCAALAAALRDVFDGYSGTGSTGTVILETTLHDETDLFDPPADDSGRGTYRTAMDFTFRYREPASQYLV